jgi:hypothetical protein
MSIQLSVAARNARLDVIETTISTSPKLYIRSGAPPTDCAAADTGTLLATIDLPSDWLANASGGSKAKAGAWTGTADGAGTCGHFRIKDSTGTTTHIQGTVGTSGADMLSDSADLTIGQTVTISAFTLSDVNA